MIGKVLALAMLLPAAVGIVGAATPRPEWCKPGWECVPTDEVVEDTIYKIDLRERLARAEARARRHGVTAGCGFGVAVTVTEDWETRNAPAAVCAVVWGWRFP